MTSSTAAAHSDAVFRRLFGSRQPYTQLPPLRCLLRLSLLLLLTFSAAALRAAEEPAGTPSVAPADQNIQRIEGGTLEQPVEITNNGTVAQYTLAPGAVVRMTASGNQIYNVVGESGGEKPVLYLVGENLGTKDGSKFANVRIVLPKLPENAIDKNRSFWMLTGCTDASVDMDIQGEQSLSIGLRRTDAPNGTLTFGDFKTNGAVWGKEAKETESITLQVKSGGAKYVSNYQLEWYGVTLSVAESGEIGEFVLERGGIAPGIIVGRAGRVRVYHEISKNAYGAIDTATQIDAEGTLELDGGSVNEKLTGTGKLIVKSILKTEDRISQYPKVIIKQDLNLTPQIMADFTGTVEFPANSGTLLLPAGKEGTMALPKEPSTAKLVLRLSPEQLKNEYTAKLDGNVTETNFAWQDEYGNPVEGKTKVYTPINIQWKDGIWTWNKTEEFPTDLPINANTTIVFDADHTVFPFPNSTSLHLNAITVRGNVAGTLKLGNGKLTYGLLSMETDVTVPVGFVEGCLRRSVTLPDGRTLAVEGTESDAEAVKVAFDGPGQLKVASKTLKLDGINTYTGGTEIASGATLEIGKPETLATAGPFSGNGTLKVTKTMDLTGKQMTVAAPAGLTLDISGVTLTADGVSVNGSASLTIAAGQDQWTEVFGTLNAPITVASDAKLTLSNGTFAQVITSDGELTITGGTFKEQLTINGGTPTVSGGTFEKALAVTGPTKFLNGGQYARRPDATWCAEGKLAVKRQGATYYTVELPKDVPMPAPNGGTTNAYDLGFVTEVLGATEGIVPAQIEVSGSYHADGAPKLTAPEDINNARALFSNITKSTAEAITVDYAFGISGITVKKVGGTNYVVLSAKVTSILGTAADYADGTTLEVLANGIPPTEAVPCDADGVSLTEVATGAVRFFRVPYTEALGTTRYTVRAVRK